MSSSALASLGLGVLTGDVYKKVLAVVIERDLGPDSVTNQFVLELTTNHQYTLISIMDQNGSNKVFKTY